MASGIIEGLTPAQQEAVEYIDGPLLVIAGAGSGKTRVVTRKIAYLLEQGVNPFAILAITFTNKAATEMRERVDSFADTKRMWIATFHSACARILRREIKRLEPYNSDFTICDDRDQRALIKQLAADLKIDTDTFKIPWLSDTISRYKNSMRNREMLELTDMPPEKLRQLVDLYEETLAKSNTLDFDDLLLLTVELLQREEVAQRYRRRFEYILVDEFQDTNALQNEFVKLLGAPDGKVCATGDPDQAIYGWRGADIGNILSFEKDYNNVRVVKLEKNFRSTNAILKCANTLIAHNEQEYHKELYSDLGEGERPHAMAAGDDEDEAQKVVETVRKMVDLGAASYSDFAVFYRTNAQSRPFEMYCSRMDVPYVVVGAVEFYRRKVVKDLLAYLKLIFNRRDELSLFRIINTPTRGIGPKTVLNLRERATLLGRSPMDIIDDPGERRHFGKRGAAAMEGFSRIYHKLADDVPDSLEKLLRKVISITAYSKQFANSDDPADRDALENIEALVNEAAQFDAEQNGGLREYLERVALVSDTDDLQEGLGAVTLMTLHAAKGLEFPYVFIAGVERDLLPHDRSTHQEDGLQEERRLFYVGITRAKKGLTVSYARRRMLHGNFKSTRPSPFLFESGIVEQRQPQRRTLYSSPKTNFDIDEFRKTFRSEPGPEPEQEPGGEIVAPAGEFDKGNIVEHPQFGTGRVEQITGSGVQRRIKVFFRNYGVKNLRYDIASRKLSLKRRQ
ncbi:MAG: UvrD-helicase domain-containing protein [Planctomycetota bacterium]|nr:UvrD-helicase domain-containing protein [Planctomycetota bacterium]